MLNHSDIQNKDTLAIVEDSDTSGRMRHKDHRLIRRAIRNGWPIPSSAKAELAEKIISDIPKCDGERALELADTLISMGHQNTRDALAALEIEKFDDTRNRLDTDRPTEILKLRANFDQLSRHNAPLSLPEAAGSDLEPGTNGCHRGLHEGG